jgi:CheY-like chemotaxis protein
MPRQSQILLVEDNEGDVELTQRAIAGQLPSCGLVVANDGLEALELLGRPGGFGEAGAPDIILLDLNMPRMDGKRFLEAVKQDERLRLIPVVMLTSSESPADVKDCYDRHANCYVVKPFDGRQFAAAVVDVARFWLERVRLAQPAN